MIKLLIILVTFLTTIPSHAWNHHQKIMEQIFGGEAGFQLEKKNHLFQHKINIPCVAQEKEMIQKLAMLLELNANKIPVFSEVVFAEKAKKCPNNNAMPIMALLQSVMIDEPDLGMDQDLPDSADLKKDRAWMGGSTGPTSQGFRHMYFAGLEWFSPLSTFQIPLHAIGQAPERFEKLHSISNEFFKSGNEFWGIRTLLWSLHFMQDLHQPFHVVQAPSLKMLPWRFLFNRFISSSNQVIANYHYAYEGLAEAWTEEATTTSFHEFFSTSTLLPINIHEVVDFSRARSSRVGSALYQIFENEMKDPEINLPEGVHEFDYYALTHQAQAPEEEAMSRLKAVTGELMKNLTTLTVSEVIQALSISSNTGK